MYFSRVTTKSYNQHTLHKVVIKTELKMNINKCILISATNSDTKRNPNSEYQHILSALPHFTLTIRPREIQSY